MLWFSSVLQNMMLYRILLTSGKLEVVCLIQLVPLNGHLLLELFYRLCCSRLHAKLITLKLITVGH